MNYFRTTLACLAVAAACLCAGLAALAGWRQREGAEFEKLARSRTGLSNTLASEKARLASMREAHPPVLRFLSAWEPFAPREGRGVATAAGMRAALEELAQRRLGLITDQVTTPEPVSIVIAGRPVAVQRISLRASGESLGAILTWLGEAEALYPFARVELCELSAGAGTGISLRLGLAQPVQEEGEERKRP